MARLSILLKLKRAAGPEAMPVMDGYYKPIGRILNRPTDHWVVQDTHVVGSKSRGPQLLAGEQVLGFCFCRGDRAMGSAPAAFRVGVWHIMTGDRA